MYCKVAIAVVVASIVVVETVARTSADSSVLAARTRRRLAPFDFQRVEADRNTKQQRKQQSSEDDDPRAVAVGQHHPQLTNNQNDCLLCHIKALEPIFADGQQPEQQQDSHLYSCFVVENDVTNGDDHLPYRRVVDMQLPEDFLNRHAALLETGNAHFCIPRSFLHDTSFSQHDHNDDGDDDEQRGHQIVVVPENTRPQLLEPIDVVSEEDAVAVPSNYNNDNPHHYNRQLHTNSRFMGVKRMLAVRIVTTFGEEPVETLNDIQEAIFGSTTGNPSTNRTANHSILLPNATIVSQYHAISHGALTWVAATGAGVENGVAQVVLDRQIAGAPVQADLTMAILAATAATLGPMDQITDRIIFCLPDGSTLQGQATWTAFTYLFEPVRALFQEDSMLRVKTSPQERFLDSRFAHTQHFAHRTSTHTCTPTVQFLSTVALYQTQCRYA